MNIAYLRNSLSSKILVFLAAVSFVFMGTFGSNKAFASGATLNVSSDATNKAYYQSITASADRLLVLQNLNGSWDWTVTGQTGPTGTTYVNITGVTGEGLLAAYSLTGKATYLEAAKDAGDYIITTIGTPDPSKRLNGFNINFLYNLSTVSGLTTYSDAATLYMNHLFGKANYFCSAPTGCDAAGIANGLKTYRTAPDSAPQGIVAWDLMPFVKAAIASGNPALATGIANQIRDYVTQTTYTSSVNYYDLGLAGAVKALNVAGVDNASILATLISRQSNILSAVEPIQLSAYTLIALKSSNNDVSAYAEFLQSQGSNGVWLDDAVEYSEVDSEVAQALSEALPSNTYYTIQDAIRVASSGDTINIGAGEYTEVEQIVIDKNLSIVGADKTTTIIKPAQDTSAAYRDDSSAWILVNSGKDFNLSKVTLDGVGRLITNAIISHGTGTIDDNNIKNIEYNASGPDYSGAGVALYSATATLSNNTFTNIGREGIFVAFFSSATINGNTYVGKGNGNWLDYAIEVGRNSTATISNNVISGNTGVAESDGSTSAGVLVTTYNDVAGVSSGATIVNNTIIDNTDGIAVGYDASDASIVTANYNKLTGNTSKGVVSTNPPVDATHNWWGTANTDAIALMVSGPVDVSNPIDDQQVILDAETDLDSSHTEVVVGDNSEDSTVTIPEDVSEPTINFTALLETSGDDKVVTTSSELTIDSSTGESGSINVTLPAGLTITGNSSWDGILNAPTNKITEFVLLGGDVSSAIEVGLTDQSLTFNKAVRLLFAGKTNKKVGYDPGNGFYPITTVCTADDQVTVDAQLGSSNGECKFDNGTDMIVWTKHFTTFAAYSSVISGGGGGGGGSYVPPTPSVPVAVNPPVVVPPALVTVPQGQVLGETLINSHAEGTFISIGKAIYLVSGGKKLPFANFSEFQSYGKVTVIAASEADKLLPDGNIIRAKSGTVALDPKEKRTIYMINEKGEKQGFASYSAFVKMKYKLSQVKRLDLSVYPIGEVIN
ncbi:MAG: right-handed parallel beta-helix repeat-containing protein [Candidatus Doudnabacteria bacterium]